MFLLTQINKIGILADDDDAQRIASPRTCLSNPVV
jgi:hypothetical protein